MEDVITNSRISWDYCVKNYRAILGYLYTLEEFQEQTEKYTGMSSMSSWKAILNAMTENITNALNTYLDNRFVFHVIENIDRELVARGSNALPRRRLRRLREDRNTKSVGVPREPKGRRKYSPPPGTYTKLLIPMPPRAHYPIKQGYRRSVSRTACL